jgi:hypothetical protein
MREEAVAFGAGNGLSGVLTHPGEPARDLAAVILNAGIVHRVGPNRLHVTLARQLARRGVAALRFDFSGLGESEPRADGLGYAERVQQETAAAIDLLTERCGLRRVALLGICSGADNGLRVARADRRVVGAGLIEGYAWESTGYHLAFFARRAASLRTWKRLVSGRSSWRGALERILASRRSASASGAAPADDAGLDALKRPEPAEVAADMLAVAESGRRMLLVYSREGVPYYNYRRLFRPRIRHLEDSGGVTVRILAATNHTFSPLGVQQRFCDVVGEWVSGLAGSA